MVCHVPHLKILVKARKCAEYARLAKRKAFFPPYINFLKVLTWSGSILDKNYDQKDPLSFTSCLDCRFLHVPPSTPDDQHLLSSVFSCLSLLITCLPHDRCQVWLEWLLPYAAAQELSGTATRSYSTSSETSSSYSMPADSDHEIAMSSRSVFTDRFHSLPLFPLCILTVCFQDVAGGLLLFPDSSTKEEEGCERAWDFLHAIWGTHSSVAHCSAGRLWWI